MKGMNVKHAGVAVLILSGCLLGVFSQAAYASNKSELARGRYLVKLGGCNDCHTPGYAQAGGKMPESDWLTGNPVGLRGRGA